MYPGLYNQWFIACRSSQLRRRPVARTVLGHPLVLFRSGAGQAAALVDRCPHRNVPLSQGRVAAGRLACPYHGWEFDGQGICRAVPGLADDASPAAKRSGEDDQDEAAPAAGPEARNAAAVPTAEQDGFVWVYHGSGAPMCRPPRFAHLGEGGYTAFSGEATLEAALPDALENFLDGTHTHFVHAGLIRSEGGGHEHGRKVVTAIVRRGAASVEAEYPDEGKQSGIITPIDDTRQRLFAVAVGQAPAIVGALAAPLIKLFFWQALRQDQRILRLQAANLRRFGEARYAYTPLDLLGPHILRLLKHGPAPQPEPMPAKRVRLRM